MRQRPFPIQIEVYELSKVKKMKINENIAELLGKKASFYLEHVCEKITKDELQVPSKNSLEKVFGSSNRNPQVLRSLSQLYNNGNLGGTGYLSILPVDQGIEHSRPFHSIKTQIISIQRTL